MIHGKMSLENYESDESFLNSLREQLYAGNYDCIFSFDYIPLLSYGAQKCGILYYSWIYDCPQFTLFLIQYIIPQSYFRL